MKLSFGQHLSQKQVQTLAPRMIQSMEILQMPLVELNERIEQELIENPVLELREKDPSLPDEAIPCDEAPQKKDVDEKELIVDEAHHNADDFERLVNLDQEMPSYFEDQGRPSSNRIQESSDRYQDLMANVAERSETLQDHLLQQLGEWELEPSLRKMCERISRRSMRKTEVTSGLPCAICSPPTRRPTNSNLRKKHFQSSSRSTRPESPPEI
jgi:RNA polymerase sigma-54 factor